MSFDGLLNKIAVISRKQTTGTDAWNHPITSDVTVAASVPVAIQPRTNKETLWDRLGVVYTHEMYLRHLTVGLITTDRVVCDGITYEVAAVDDGAGRMHHWEIALKQVV